MIAIQYCSGAWPVCCAPGRGISTRHWQRGGEFVLRMRHSGNQRIVASPERLENNPRGAPTTDSDGHEDPAWQPSLFGQGDPRPDADFSGLTRHELRSTAWVDHVAGWLQGADGLFEELLGSAPWESTTQELYGKVVVTPRLVARWPAPSDLSRLPPVIGRMCDLLAARYRRPFDSVSANLYR